MNEIIHNIKNHRSIRNFETTAVDDTILDEILHAAQAMPNSINGQQTSVIVVKDKAAKKKISELSGNQTWIDEAPVFLVFIMDFYKTDLAAKKNQLTQVIHESVEGTIVGTFDAGLQMGATIIAAESLGLGIVPIGGVRRNPKEMIELLQLPEYTFPVAGLALGYPKGESRQKPRLPYNTFRHNEVYQKDGLMDQINQYDKLMEDYLAEIGRSQEGNWTSYTSNLYQYVYYPNVYPVLKDQKFTNDK